MPDLKELIKIGASVDDYVQKFFTWPQYTPLFIDDIMVLDTLLRRLRKEHGIRDDDIWYKCNVIKYGDKKTNILFRINDRKSKYLQQMFEDYRALIKYYGKEPDAFSFFEGNKASGESTRIADEAIKKYFNAKPGKYIDIVDHWPERRADSMLTDTVVGRLKYEYGLDTSNVRTGCSRLRRNFIEGFDEKVEEDA